MWVTFRLKCFGSVFPFAIYGSSLSILTAALVFVQNCLVYLATCWKRRMYCAGWGNVWGGQTVVCVNQGISWLWERVAASWESLMLFAAVCGRAASAAWIWWRTQIHTTRKTLPTALPTYALSYPKKNMFSYTWLPSTKCWWISAISSEPACKKEGWKFTTVDRARFHECV